MAHKHIRARIRKHVVDLLKVGVDIGGRVFASRPNPVWLTQEMPLILVYFEVENNDEEDKNPPKIKRTLRLNVEVLHSGKVEECIDDYLDDRAYEVENTLFVDENWIVVEIEDLRLVTTLAYTPQHEGQNIISATKMTFEIDYYTLKGEYSTYDEFLRFTNTISISEESANAVDDVTIREE